MKTRYLRPALTAIHIGTGTPLAMSQNPTDVADARRRADFDYDDNEEDDEPFVTPLKDSPEYFGFLTLKDLQDDFMK